MQFCTTIIKAAEGAKRFKSLGLLLFFLLCLSCGGNKDSLQIKGKFTGFNQGELYIFGMHGDHKLDTISVAKGQFQYRIHLEDTITLVLMFPNASELPIFAEPGAEIEIEGDASHLKETEVTGTDDNKLMTAFRLQTSKMTPPEVFNAATTFINEHPTSPASLYILDRYFVRSDIVDYPHILELAQVISKAMPEDKEIAAFCQKIAGLKALKDGNKLPSFTATDFDGKRVSSADLNAKVNVINVWASWNYESISLQALLRRLRKKYGDDNLKILSVCVDANEKECKRILNRDSIMWSNVCDGRLWESPILQKTGLSNMPDNILTDSKGKIIAHSLNYQKLSKKISELLE
ncbi:MAG: AhpC/TSA family protein [Prevotella sp.]|jgi:hypothetical protein|nr:AhpC/TSA family protein [Prevotella sp.]